MDLQLRRKKPGSLALAFAIPCVGMLFVMLISQYEPFGKYSMLYSDMYHQYYPFFAAFRRALRSGDGLLYTWSTGLGMDYLGLISYYLASPLNLLSVLVPEGWLLEFFSLLVPVKLGLAGLFFALFLQKTFRRTDWSTAVFGGCYGLCAWALGFQWNVMWLDTFALLPLVVLGLKALLEEKKFLLYTGTLFLSIFSNYYIGLFTCIFVFLTFFVYQFCRWGGWKKFFADLFRVGLFSVLAIGMTAILELPALAALQTTQSSVNKFPTGFRLNIADEHTWKGLLDAMRQVAGNMGGAIKPNFKEGLPNLYCGIFSILLMFLYLLSPDVRLRDKLCAVGLLVFFNLSFIIRQLDYIWHGFHFTNMIPYRFSFLYSFVVLYMAYRAWTLRQRFDGRRVVLAALLTAGILACCKDLKTTVPVGSLDIPVYIIYNGVFLALYTMALLAGAGREAEDEPGAIGKKLLLGILCAELVGTLVCFGLYFTGTSVANYPKGTEHTASVIRYMHEREADNPFFRAETTHSQTLNDGALNNYNGITTFTSSANVHVTEFMKALGFSAKNTYNRYLYEESSPVADLFLGLKYRIERDGRDRSSSFYTVANSFGSTTLLENRAYLPLAFLAEEALGELTFDASVNAFHFQDQLFSAATGLNQDVWHRISGEDQQVTGTDTVTVEDVSAGGSVRYSAEAGGELSYSFTARRDGYACLHLNLPKRNDYHVSVNGADLYKETISLPQMIAVGDVKAGDVIGVRIEIDAGENSTATVSAAILDGELFWQGYERLNAATWRLTSFKPTRVAGVIRCDREGLLYTSIPQNGNWTATVDGRRTETVLVGDCMAALPLSQGTHEVVLTYRNPAFSLGWKISLLSALAFAAIAAAAYRPAWLVKGKKGKFQK
ncbi:MAG: YfhO family protein [Eubacteriales bacterium]|nr:YfhO family protein [Eubacteriales bacterium]